MNKDRRSMIYEYKRKYRLTVLKYYAVKFSDINVDTVKRRDEFDRKKAALWYKWSGKKCACCSGRFQVIHHIIPIKNGGLNIVGNLVELCRMCHSKIHPWLRA